MVVLDQRLVSAQIATPSTTAAIPENTNGSRTEIPGSQLKYPTNMSAATDPLLALKQTLKSQTQIEYSSHTPQLKIGNNVFPKSTSTRYRKPGGDFYSIEAIYLAWLLKDATGAEYMKQTREHGLTVGFVSVTERKHVVDWLEGKTSDQDRVAPLDCELSDYISRHYEYLPLQ